MPRRRVEEALLEDRLGLHDEWVERWEQGGKCVEESLAPAGLPPFIHDHAQPRQGLRRGGAHQAAGEGGVPSARPVLLPGRTKPRG